MAKRKWVVRIVNEPGSTIPGPWLECFRYAGIVQVHENGERQVFDLHAPPVTDSQVWARMNAERIASFGINAVAAPAWVGSLTRPPG